MKENQKRNRLKKLSGEESLQKIKGNCTVSKNSISYKPIISNLPTISSIENTHGLIRKLWDKENLSTQEQFVAYFFNSNSHLLEIG
ncbi:hypothetical protein [Flavisolibacter tropicus]|nr:hypothetical protein [Flavisolibacter tropicus]